MGYVSISVRFHQILENLKQSSELQGNVFEAVRYEEWIAQFYMLADLQLHHFEENQKLLDSILEEFETEDVPEEKYEELYQCFVSLKQAEYKDTGLEEDILGILIPHYEFQNDVEKMIILYARAGFIYMELSRTGFADFSELARGYLDKMLKYRYDPIVLRDVDHILRMIGGFANLTAPAVSLKMVTLKEAYEYWKEFRIYIEKEEIIYQIKKSSKIQEFVVFTENWFPKMGFMLYYEAQCEEEEEFYPVMLDLAKHRYFNGTILPEELEDPYKEDFYLYHCLCVETESESPEKAFWLMDSFYREHMIQDYERLTETKIPVGLLINPIIRILFVLDKTSLPEVEKARIVRYYKNQVLHIVHVFDQLKLSYAVNSALGDIVTNKTLFRYMESPEEKLDFMIKLTISRQIMTIVHSTMVSRLVVMILEEVIEKNPELLLSINEVESIEQVKQHKEDILRYAKNAAMMHDIGKTVMVNTIQVTHRRLTEAEYMIIKNHPRRGVNFLKVDPYFEKFQDVVLGHHKYYDGSGGYEINFDNTKSNVKILVDLITICDCMDAATDYLGRNFRRAKTFDQLFLELKKEAGTLYNPELISFVDNNQDLYNSIKRILGPARTEIYYKIYQDYL